MGDVLGFGGTAAVKARDVSVAKQGAALSRPPRTTRNGAAWRAPLLDGASSFRALGVSVGLSVVFLIVYGGCNWITAQRANVGSIFLEWERHLPFVPLLIAPYFSIDLFFVAAPFLCGSERELRTFAKRISAAIIVAGMCFLAFPLRYAFVRPQTAGWLGAVFDWFRTMDAPFNLFPSLHVALSALLVVIYARHSRSWLRGPLVFWFALIVVSAVLTYQHHVLDVVGGFALAGYCFYFIRESPLVSPVMREPRIGWRYATGALLLFLSAIVFWPWGAILFWPASALAIVAAAYFGIGPAIFRKADGVLPWSTIWVLGPVLVGQHLSRTYYRRQCRAWDAVTSNVWIGSALNNRAAPAAVSAGVTSVLDLTAEFSAPRAFRKLRYRNLPILDLTAPTQEQLDEMADYIATESERGIVYVHCKIGYSRSAAAVCSHLIRSGQADGVESCLALLRRVRPSIVVRPEVIRALEKFNLRASQDCARV